MKTEAVPEEVARALWVRTVRDALATELAGSSEEERAKVEAYAEKVWRETLLASCLKNGVVVPHEQKKVPRSDEVGRKQRAQEEEAEARLAAARAELAEKQRLVALCREQIVPALEDKLRTDASVKCQAALKTPALAGELSRQEQKPSADDAVMADEEEQALLQLATERISETLKTMDAVDANIKDVQQRTERVLSFSSQI